MCSLKFGHCLIKEEQEKVCPLKVLDWMKKGPIKSHQESQQSCYKGGCSLTFHNPLARVSSSLRSQRGYIRWCSMIKDDTGWY